MNLNALSLAALCLLSSLASAQHPAPKPVADPVLAPVADVPGLPRVLIVGDSVSMGYTLPVRALLKDKANVHRIPQNGGATSVGLANLARWLGEEKWDVIHFNFGLHDAKLLPEGNHHADPDGYAQNLRAIVQQLRATGAKLIWATTTPVPDGGILSPIRRFGDIGAYNAAAKKVMDENGVAIDDLGAAVQPEVARLQNPHDVHFSKEGSQFLAERVAASIAAQLPKK